MSANIQDYDDDTRSLIKLRTHYSGEKSFKVLLNFWKVLLSHNSEKNDTS